MDELTDVQRLAVAQAVYKAVSGVVSTKDEDSLRSECDRVLVEQYEQTGAKSYDVPINGIKVGTYSVKVSKAKPKRKAPRAWVDDWDEFIDWLTNDDGADWLRHLVEEHGDALALDILRETGEVAPGCVAQPDYCEPAEPARVTGTTLRVDADAVAEAMGPMLGERVMGLLGGAE
jgi:hypothetical protein